MEWRITLINLTVSTTSWVTNDEASIDQSQPEQEAYRQQLESKSSDEVETSCPAIDYDSSSSGSTPGRHPANILSQEEYPTDQWAVIERGPCQLGFKNSYNDFPYDQDKQRLNPARYKHQLGSSGTVERQWLGQTDCFASVAGCSAKNPMKYLGNAGLIHVWAFLLIRKG